MRKVEIDRTQTTSTPVTPNISEMLKKLATWNPTTLEQVIKACERLIHAANEDIYYGNFHADNSDRKIYFNSLTNKLIRYSNGIVDSADYLYVTGVEIVEEDMDTSVKLSGIRLARHNRFGNETVQEYTLPLMYSAIMETRASGFSVMGHGYRVDYSIINTQAEYIDAVTRMKNIASKAIEIPDYLSCGSVKINLHKNRFTKTAYTDDNKEGQTPATSKGGNKWARRPTSTTTGRAASKSCAEPSGTTSSSQGTTANGTGKPTRQRPASGTSRRNVSRKSPRSSSSS